MFVAVLLTASLSVAAAAEERTTAGRPEVFRARNGDRTPVQFDRWGRTVMDDAGRKIRYPGPGSGPTREWTPAWARRAGGEAPSGGPPYALQWHRSMFGIAIGFRGMYTVDLDGDGAAEIVATALGYDPFWYVLSHRGGQYVHVFASTPYADDIDSLVVGNADADASPEILVGSGHRVFIYDGVTRALQTTIVTTAAAVRGLQVADLDGDGTFEVAFCDDNNLYVYDVASGGLEYLGIGRGGWDLAVGNVDNDAALEIVVGNGSDPGYVVDGQSHALEWTNPWGFGYLVRLGDVDGDGRQEAVASLWGGDIQIFDVELQSLAGSIPVALAVDALRVADVEGDGSLEIVYGDDQWGEVHVYNGQTLMEKWSVPNPDSGVTNIAVGDTDGDGTGELLFAAGYYSSGPDHLYVVDTAAHSVEWTSTDFAGPFRALSWGDIDADGHVEFLSGSFESDSGYGDGLFFVHDALTQELEYQSGPTTDENWTGLWRIRNANVDADPQQEIFVTTSEFYSGIIICYDGITHAEQWRAQIPSGQSFTSMAVADVDNDGQLEIAAGVETLSSTSGSVYVFNAASGALEWHSPSLVPPFADLSLMRIADVDGDGHLEIVVGNYESAIFVIDGVTHTIQNLGNHGVTALDTPDRDGDGVAEVVIGTETGAIQVLDAFSGTVIQTVGNYIERIDGLAVRDVTGSPAADYAFALNGEVFVYDGATNAVAWSSGVLGYSAGAEDSLLIGDVDGDGVLELVVSMGTSGFRVYEGGPLRLFAGDATVGEAAGGVATFTVALSAAAATPVTVQYATANGTATAGSDYLATSGTLVFPPNTTTKTVSVTVLDDTVYEGNETFFLNLSSPTGATIQDGQGTGTIVENEPAILISVDDVAVVEGSSGTTSATFVVNLSSASTLTTTVSYATADGTATAPGDYQPGTGTVTFAPGVVSQTVTVQVVADAVVETDETFLVNLSGPVNAAIADGEAVGTILDDDAPSLSTLELSHGSEIVTDLAAQPGPAADEDFYRIGQEPRTSYEVVVDAVSGDIVPVVLERLAANNVTVLQTAGPVATGSAVSLRWTNVLPTLVTNQHLRVRSGGCSTGCGTDDQYRVRVYETTYTIPRFNNAGSQLTVLLIQNPTSYAVSGQVYFWHTSGTLLHAQAFALPAKGLLTLNTAGIAALADQGGSITVSNDAHYGDLTGKTVALEPSTGFSFDSPMVVQPR